PTLVPERSHCGACTVYLYPLRFTAPTPLEASSFSLHAALPISGAAGRSCSGGSREAPESQGGAAEDPLLVLRREEGNVLPDQFQDRKSTRLNSSHVKISYAVFCLKKKKKRNQRR